MTKYYIAPSDEIFEEVRNAAIELWKEVDSDNDKFGYATSKINRIKDIENVSDNFMYIVAMFDYGNIKKLMSKVSPEGQKEINNRLI